MDCGKMMGLVALQAGGDTTDEERIAVEAHLSGCADCAREYEGFRAGRTMLSELREGVAPAGAIEGIWTRLQPQIAPKAAAPLRFEWALRMAAVLVIGVTVGYLITSGARPATREGLPVNSPLVNYTHRGNSSREIGTDTGAVAPANNPSRPVLPTRNLRLFERTAPMSGPHYLPRVEKVVSPDERSF